MSFLSSGCGPLFLGGPASFHGQIKGLCLGLWPGVAVNLYGKQQEVLTTSSPSLSHSPFLFWDGLCVPNSLTFQTERLLLRRSNSPTTNSPARVIRPGNGNAQIRIIIFPQQWVHRKFSSSVLWYKWSENLFEPCLLTCVNLFFVLFFCLCLFLSRHQCRLQRR